MWSRMLSNTNLGTHPLEELELFMACCQSWDKVGECAEWITDTVN